MYDSATFKLVKTVKLLLKLKKDYKLGDNEDMIHSLEVAKNYNSPN